MRFTAFIFTFFLFSTAAFSQTSYKISVQANYAPGYRLNYARYNEANSVSLKLSAYNLEASPVEAGVFISTGYHRNLSFSYGASLAYIFTTEKNYLVKAGFNGGRIKMGKYRDNVEVGGIVADDLHTTIQPFVELEWLFSKYLSVYMQSGYRMISSETSRVTEILDRTDYGYSIAYKTSTPMGWYSSGFQFSVGLSISIDSE